MSTLKVNKSKYILKNYEELWTKIKELFSSKTNNSGNYDKSNIKIKYNSHDDLQLKKTRTL